MFSKFAITLTVATVALVNGLPLNEEAPLIPQHQRQARDGMPTVIVPGYSINVTDWTGTTSEISTGTWVQLRSRANNQFFQSVNDGSFQGDHGMSKDGRYGMGVDNAMEDYTKFMVLVTDGDSKQIQLMDKDGFCYKRFYSDAQYYMSPGSGINYCDEYALINIKDAADGKGFLLTQGGYTLQSILNYGRYYLGMTDQAENEWQTFSFLVTDPPADSNSLVKENKLTNVQYDMANGKATLQPTNVGSVKCSTGAASQTVTLKQTKSASSTSTFSSSANMEVGMSVSFEAGVPLTVKSTETYSMSMSETMTKTNGETITETTESDVVISCPPNSVSVIDMMWQSGVYEIPYTADLERVIEVNGVPTKYIFKGLTGVYNGVSGQDITVCDEMGEAGCNFDVYPIELTN